MASDPYHLREPAKATYDRLKVKRQKVIDQARALAEITIPSVFPPEGYEAGDELPYETNQSVGAECVKTLGSKLMTMALPPDRPCLRYETIETKLQANIKAEPNLWSKMQETLGRREIQHRERLEATAIRSAYVGGIKQLLVAGNVMWKHIDIDHPTYHRMTEYVVRRNKQGEQLLVIQEETLNVAELDEDQKDAVYTSKPELRKEAELEQEIKVYCVCKGFKDDNGKQRWAYWEELEDSTIMPGSEDTSDDEPQLFAAWLIPVYGKDWGLSYCQEYRGDLYSVENYSAALNDGASAASLIWLFLSPGARTSLRQLKQAKNLSMHVGRGEDVTAFKLDKASDFSFVLQNLEQAIRRLARGFLLKAAIQRQAERVTAEEWTQMAQELEEAMGGLYSELAQSFQTHVIRRFVALHSADDEGLAALPKGIFRVAVITGLESMGRTTEGQSLARAIDTANKLSNGKWVEMFIDGRDALRRILTSESVKSDGLLKSDEQVQQDAQQEQLKAAQQELLSKATGPVAGAVAQGAVQQQLPPQQ